MGRKCQHNHFPRKRWRNMRDDRSFEFYYTCPKCNEVMWDECKDKPEGMTYG